MTQFEFLRIATATVGILWVIFTTIGVALVWEFRRICGFWKPLGEMVLLSVFGLALGATTGVALDAVFPDLIQRQETEPHRPTGRMIPGATYTPTPTATSTPEPDPCSACPDPASFTCLMWPTICYQCWEDCGQPIATPTPTRTPTKTPTRTPTPAPTSNCPPCALTGVSGNFSLKAFYAHESKTLGTRYTFTTPPYYIAPGTVAQAQYCQGYPVGFQWLNEAGSVVKSCGDVTTIYPPTPTPTPGPALIFSDGFETGDASAWSLEVGDE